MKRDDWRPSIYGLERDIRTVKLADLRKIRKSEAVGLVHRLHDWMTEYTDDGYLPEVSMSILAEEIFGLDAKDEHI